MMSELTHHSNGGHSTSRGCYSMEAELMKLSTKNVGNKSRYTAISHAIHEGAQKYSLGNEPLTYNTLQQLLNGY